MTRVPDPQTFMAAVAQFGRRGRRERVNRLARIDPAYVASSWPGVSPRVVFDGESTPTVKRYRVIGAYAPKPGDRVLMVPVGTTYVILGDVRGG